MNEQRSISDTITWEELGDAVWKRDYDEGYSVNSRSSRHTEVEVYHLKDLQVLRATGVYKRNWHDGRLLHREIFDLEELMCSTSFEFRQVGCFIKRQCLSAIWFPARRYELSAYYKTVPSAALEKWSNAHLSEPEITLFGASDPELTNCYVAESRLKATRGSGLRLRVPYKDGTEWLPFARFIKKIGERILMAEDHRISSKALA